MAFYLFIVQSGQSIYVVNQIIIIASAYIKDFP